MNPNRMPTAQLLAKLRWVIPLALSIVGITHILSNEVGQEGRALYSAEIFLTFLILAVIGPAFAWYTLKKAAASARAEAKTRIELEKSNQELAALNAISDVVSTSLDLETIFDLSLRKMVEILQLEAGEIRVVRKADLVLVNHYGVSDEFVAREKTIPLGECLCGKCAQDGRLLSNTCLSSNPALKNSACALEGFASTLSVPMEVNGHIIGVIHIASRQQDAFPTTYRRMMRAISQRIAIAAENARLYEKLQRHTIHFETASLVGQRVTALMELNTLLREVVRVIHDNFGYYHVHIFLVDENSREIVLRAASGTSAAKLTEQDLRLKIGDEGITGRVAHTGQTMVCRDVTREPRYWKSELLPETQSEIAVPLRVGTRIIGVLDIQSNHLDSFEKEDVTVLQILGNQLGIAIENARLFAETKSRYDAMMALHEISLDVISQLDRTQLMEALLQRGVNLWQAAAGYVAFYDPKRGEIQVAANYKMPWDLTQIAFHPGQGVIGKVIQSGEPLIVNNYQNWAGRIEEYTTSPLSAIMCAPLKWQDQIFGGICILQNSKEHIFEPQDLWLLTCFAELAAIAIKNAELHSQIIELNQGLEQKVEDRTTELSQAKAEIESQALQLRSLLAKTIHLQEEERARIARDMHDGVMQLITAMRYELKAAEIGAGPAPASPVPEKLASIREVLGEMESELRRAIYDLHPPALDAADLVSALRKYTETFQKVFGIRCELSVDGVPNPLPDTTQVAVFRIVEEALQNVAAHAQANVTRVCLDFGVDRLDVLVQDDGRGFDYHKRTPFQNLNQLGLVSMEERVRILHGTMNVRSNSREGTALRFSLPLVRAQG